MEGEVSNLSYIAAHFSHFGQDRPEACETSSLFDSLPFLSTSEEYTAPVGRSLIDLALIKMAKPCLFVSSFHKLVSSSQSYVPFTEFQHTPGKFAHSFADASSLLSTEEAVITHQ